MQARRAYRSPQRAAQAAQTRERLIAASRALFAERGWAGTTLKAIAQQAGVAEPTVYAVFGSKSALAMALLDEVDAAADVPLLLAGLEAAASDPRAQLSAIVDFEQRLYDGAHDLVRLIRDGARESDELAAAYADGNRRGDEGRRRVFERWEPEWFRDGVDLEHALDVSSVAFSFEVWDLLAERGWPSERIASWCLDWMSRELLA